MDIKKLLSILLVGALTLLSSCDEDEPKNPFEDWVDDPDSPEWNDPNSGENSDDNYQSIKTLVNQHVSATASYREYAWYFTIESTLETVLDKRIQYGIGHGDIDGFEYVSVGSDAYYYSMNVLSNGTRKIEFCNPFYFYYIFGGHQDNDIWVDTELYYRIYNELNPKSSLTLEEKNFLNDVIGYLNDYEKEANSYYQPSIYVLIDGKYYLVKRFKR